MTDTIRILVVDDEIEYLASLERVLARRGFAVRTAPDGGSALAVLQNAPFDCIVLDMNMPGMDGLATLEALRKGDQLTPVLLLTGHGEIPSVLSALKRGSVGFLAKPCSVDELISAIEDASERRALTVAFEEGKSRSANR